jgi:hypothetical protein
MSAVQPSLSLRLTARHPCLRYGLEPVGKGQAAAGFRAVFAPGVAAVDGATGAIIERAAGFAGFTAGLAFFFAAFFLAAGFLAFFTGFLAFFLAGFFLSAFFFAGFFLATFFLAAFFFAGFLATALCFFLAFLAGFFAAFFAFFFVAMVKLLLQVKEKQLLQTRPG